MIWREFDRLHVVSDLHMGGREQQIFCQGETLAAFIDSLTERRGGRVGLVINGDIVDFLAEEPASYLDSGQAIIKLERICEDPSFAPVFQALARFVGKAGRTLVLVLGNHDVELAVPPVREWLVRRLSGGKEARRGRIVTAFDGSGFACRVGRRRHGYKRVLCLHGNEVDPWNVIDYHALLQTSRALNRGEVPSAWNANGGTRMVVDVLNAIKRQYPFVELLKPETEAVVPCLIALDPGQLKKLGGILRVQRYVARDRVRMAAGWLSADEELGPEEPDETEVVGDLLRRQFEDSGEWSEDEIANLLLRAQVKIDLGVDPKGEVDSGDDEFLGFWDPVKKIFGKSTERQELLRRSLEKKLEGDRTFAHDHQDETFKALRDEVGREVDYLLAGHTHLARSLTRSAGTYYFNSGTWIRLIDLEGHLSKTAFAKVFKALGAGRLADLDQVKSEGGTSPDLVRLHPTVVSIIGDEGAVYGQLETARADGGLDPLPGTRKPEA